MAKRAVKDSVRTRSFYIKRHYPAKKREQGRTGFSIERKEKQGKQRNRGSLPGKI